MTTLRHHPLTEAQKREICAWRYEGEYAVYTLPSYEEMRARNSSFTNPDRAENYHGFSIGGTLIGYVNLTEKGDGIHLGVGVHPDFCNRGYGRRMIEAAAQIAREKYPGKPLCLEVRTWNERAIRCYQSAGFKIVTAPYMQTTGAGKGMFYKMRKEPS